MDPFTSGTVWIAGLASSAAPNLNGGIYRSADCGASWTHVNTGNNGPQFDGSSIWSMAVDYSQPNTLIVTGAVGPGGLWKSTDGGQSWTNLMPTGSPAANIVPLNPGPNATAMTDTIVMDPSNPLHLMAGTMADCLPAANSWCEIESTDGGITWRAISIGIPGLSGYQHQTGPYILGGQTSLYATINFGLWLTRDDGATWTNVTPPEVTGASGAEYDHRPFIKSAAGKFYLPAFGGLSGLLVSTDGMTWSHVPGSPAGGYNVALATGGGNVYMCDWQGAGCWTASETNLSVWTNIGQPSLTGGGPCSLEYDEAHHLLYAAQNSWTGGGVYRMVTP